MPPGANTGNEATEFGTYTPYMVEKMLHTIGHGNRSAEDFLSLLQSYGIQYLADVRSKPYSRFNPQFNRERLKAFLEQHGIRYVYMGHSLGGKPEDRSCYSESGKVDYSILQHKDFFLRGIERLKTAYTKGIHLAIMCSESNPCHCHRSKLIGQSLHAQQIGLCHIDEKGNPKTQDDVIHDSTHGQSGLFE